MVLGVVLRGYLIADTACHGDSRQTGGTDEGVDFLLGKDVPNLHHEDAGCDGKGKGTESACHDAQRLDIEECLGGHRRSYGKTEEDGGGVHDGIGGDIVEAAGGCTDLLDEVSEHEHTYQRYRCGDKEGHNGGDGDGEDNLQHPEVADFGIVGIEFVLLLHVDHQFLLGAEAFHDQRNDDGHKGHVAVCGNGDGAEQMRCQLDGGKDGGREGIYCPCDEMRVTAIKGVGNKNITNTIWLVSTTKVQTPTFNDYAFMTLTHSNDSDFKNIKV